MRFVLLAWAGIAAQLVAAVVCGFTLLSAAYRYPGISSRDDLWRLGDAPRMGFVALLVIGVVAFSATVALLADQRTRRWAWVSPAVGIATSIVATIVAIACYQEPVPLVGG
ncbi:MAG: hypothetical protein QM598_14260 [Protaetiibacter sp.]